MRIISSNEPKNTTSVFLQLFEKRNRFERFAALYIHDAETVRDIVMDSYHYMWERRESLDMGGNVEAYMYSMVKNRCLDHLQRLTVRQSVEEKMMTDAEWELQMNITTLKAFDPTWLYDSELTERIRQAVDRLPERTRLIFTMSRQREMTYAEIATELQVSVKTVEFHITRALRALRADLGDLFLLAILLSA